MRPRVNRRKLTAGSLVIVTVIWTFDMLTGPSPEVSQAASLAPSVTPAPLPVDPVDRQALERFLASEDTTPPSPDFTAVARDPFVPTERFLTALRPPPPPAPAQELPVVAEVLEPEAPRVPFAQRYKLEGVISGRVPQALIDGKSLRLNAELDGFRLIKIERDRVTFARGRERQVLILPERKTP